MKCSKCGFEDNGDSKFCSECGSPLIIEEKATEEVKVVEEVKKEEPKTPEVVPVIDTPAPTVNKFAPDTGAVDMGKSDVVPEAPKSQPAPAPVVAPVAPVTKEEPLTKADKKAAKLADKEAKKNAKIEEKKTAKSQKVIAKAEAEQAKIDACPKCYKPVSATRYFWLMFINAIPVIGLIFSFFASLISPNRNIKRFEKAACIWSVILTLIVAGLICVGVFYFGDDNIFDIIYDLGDALGF